MQLRSLLNAAGSGWSSRADALLAPGEDGPRIIDVVHDSRATGPGVLFCCVRGSKTDGHLFAADAVAAGAAALLCDHPLGTGVPEIVVTDTRRAMAQLAAAQHGHPSRSLRVIGITGTNGKTTTTHMVRAILSHHGWASEVIGTLTGARTTPESTDLQRTLAEMRDRGVDAVVMEVSSHALTLHRVAETTFAAVAFTNLSRDHLDFHGTMEQYFAAKASLFTGAFAPLAVVDVDTAHGLLLASTSDIPTVIRVGLGLVQLRSMSAQGTSYRWRDQDVMLPLPGEFNLSNAVLASEICVGLGVAPGVVAEAVGSFVAVPGRFERVALDAPFTVIVDYAHTPDALEKTLSTARALAAPGHRVLVVFGCGGDRDTTKRPHMGRVASEHADVVVITSDNPRSENPATIASQIVAGMTRRPEVIELDRRNAIARALSEARPGDIVVLAGKGHETTQEIGEERLHFEDAVVARELIGAVMRGGPA